MEAWFETYKDRLEKEYEGFKKLNVDYKLDEEAWAYKIVRLSLHIDGSNAEFKLPDNKSINLVVIYPDNYPFFRPEVYGYDIDLPRHQDPIEKGLCLIPRSTEFWYPESTVATFLKEQLEKLLVKGNITDEELLKEDADEQAEPVSEFYLHAHTPVIFDPTVFNVEFTDEKIVLLAKTRVGIPTNAGILTRTAVLEVTDAHDKILSKIPEGVQKVFPNIIRGVLYKLPERPPFADPFKDFDWLVNKLNEQGEKIIFHGTSYRSQGEEIKNIIGLCFPEEVGPGKVGMGWLFLTVSHFSERVKKEDKSFAYVKKQRIYYSKISRINKDEINIRIPALKPLGEKTVAVIGLGALGAPAAIEFARCGVKELKIWDFDLIAAGTTVRWPFGLSAAGLPKTIVLKEFIELNYPYTKVVIENRKIGGIRGGGKTIQGDIESEREALHNFFKDASLIFDATAELGIMHFLSYEAQRRDIPYVCIQATEGAAGGIIMKVDPKENDGCWMCIRMAQDDATIISAPADGSGKIQPIGCADVTFTGAGFDLQNISLAGVRMAIGILCSEMESGYSEIDSNVAVLSLIDADKQPIFPKWTSYKITKNPNCPYCAED